MGGNLQALLFIMNRPERIRQSSLLMVLATGLGDSESLLSGLKSLAMESKPPWSNRIIQLRVLLEQGQSLSEALSTARGILPDDTCTAIRVAEECGTLRQVLADEARRLMDNESAGTAVQASLPATGIWILAIWVMSASIVSFIMMWIIPKFKKIFEDFGTDLPDMTELLISYSDWFLAYWYLMALPGLTFIAFPGWYILRGYLNYLSYGRIQLAEHVPRMWSSLILRLLSLVVATGTSLENGIHAILKELQPGNAAAKLSAVRQRMMAGDDCLEALASQGFLKDREVTFLEASRRTGHLDWGLLHLSRTIDRRRGRWALRIAGLIQPCVLLAMGSVVAFIVIALFLPLIKLLNDLS